MPDELKEKVHSIMKAHVGSEKSITASRISELTGADDRTIRLKIRALIAEGVPIASAVSGPRGFFHVANFEEATRYAQSLKNRLIEDANRRKDFLQGAKAHFTQKQQLRLFG